MAHFDIDLSLPSYSLHQEEANVKFNVCYCCLGHNEVMFNLTNCKHKDFLREYFRMESFTVCIICHNMLKKITNFRQQVRKSYELLQQGVLYENTTKIASLQRSSILLTSNLEDYEVKHETSDQEYSELDIKQHASDGSLLQISSELDLKEEFTKESPIEISSDIKIEHDNSDFENDLPLSQVKSINTIKKARKNQIPSLEEKFIGKIGILILSKEELMLERKREALSEAYLKSPFKCESCIKGFNIERTMQAHNKNQHMKDGIKCDICFTVLRSEASYKEHAKRHVTRYVCIECGKRSSFIFCLADHYNKHHTDKEPIEMEFSCSECDYITNSHRSIRYHRYKHKPFPQCADCGKTFTNASSLRKHVDVVHNKYIRFFKCTKCDKTYRCKSGLLNHQASHDLGAPPLQSQNCQASHDHGAPPLQSHYCAPCQKHFATKSSLNHHLKTHSSHVTEESKRFACQHCDAKFLNKNELKAHIEWDHLKSVKHECLKCHKVFKYAKVLKIHNAFVHEKKKLPKNKICDYCGKAYSTTRMLVIHIRTHTGARPLHCPHCPATFAHPAARYTHIKLKHKK